MSTSAKKTKSSTKSTKQVKPVNKPKQTTKKPHLARWQIGLICGVTVAFVALLLVIILLFCNRKTSQPSATDDSDTETVAAIDYDQKVTNQDGSDFTAVYQAGSEQDFTIRFTDLKCDDTCQNVGAVKLGDQLLKLGEDYTVKSGSIIISLTANLMKSLAAGDFSLIITVTHDGHDNLYGVKFTVKPEPTCNENETLEKGQCVKKAEAQTTTSQGNTSGTGNSNTTSSNTPSGTTNQPSAAQAACERRAGPTGFIEVSYLTAEEKQNWINDMGASSDIVALVMAGNFQGTTKMVWKNGQCQVSFNGAYPIGGRSQPYNTAQLPAKAKANPNRNAVIWLWADGSEQIEFVNDPYTFINQHN